MRTSTWAAPLSLLVCAACSEARPSDAATDTTVTNEETPEETGASETGDEPAIVIERIEGKYGEVCGFRANASAVCWGLLGSDMIDPASEGWLEPPYPPFEQIVQAGTVCGLHDGTVYCWGPNYEIGLLGSGLSEKGELEFEQALERGGVAIGEPGERVVAIGSAVETDVIDGQACALTDAGRVFCWGSMASDGYPGFEVIGDDETPAEVGPIALGEPAVAIAVGTLGVCATLASGGVRCWGSHRLTGVETMVGQDIVPADNPVLDLGGSIQAVSIGISHACAIVGDGQVKCWGYAALSGELGHPGMIESLPVPALDPIALGGKAVEVAAGWSSSCARLESGEVVCWGSGQYAKSGHPWAAACEGDWGFECDADPSCCIGDDETPASVGAIDLPGPAVDLTDAGMGWCALLEGGAVHCWGSGVLGLLGDGQTPDCVHPDRPEPQCGLDPRCCVGDDETPAAADRPVVFE